MTWAEREQAPGSGRHTQAKPDFADGICDSGDIAVENFVEI